MYTNVMFNTLTKVYFEIGIENEKHFYPKLQFELCSGLKSVKFSLALKNPTSFKLFFEMH